MLQIFSLTTEEEILIATQFLTTSIKTVAWESTPPNIAINSKLTTSVRIKDKKNEKRKARKKWQSTRFPLDKQILTNTKNKQILK